MNGETEYVRRKVSVMVLHAKDGSMHPMELIWDDGRRFKVERCGEPVLTKCRHSSEYAVLYPVRINGRRKELYRGDGGWFVEARSDAAAPCDPRRCGIPE